MEIKIIINEAGTGRGTRRVMGEGRRADRGKWMGDSPRARHGGRRHEGWGRGAHRQEGDDRPTERGRVIGKVIELPDGRVKIVSREGMEMGRGPRRHRVAGRHGEQWRHGEQPGRRHHEGPGGWARRHDHDESDEAREARRARRRLAREIVRALEEGGYNKA